MPYADPEARRKNARDRYVRKGDAARAYHRSYYADLAPEQRAAKEKRDKAWQAANPSKTKAMQRRARLKAAYGLTPEQYDEMLAKQGGGCAICADDNGSHRLAVDHDHTTGAVRGLLCHGCNHLLGKARDKVAILRAAIDYLEKSR